MPNQSVGGRRLIPSLRSNRKRRALVLALVFSLMIVGAASARWSRFIPSAPTHSAVTAAPVQTGPTPTRPSKEYIYMGARLVATEEPLGPTNLRYIQTSASEFTTFGYLSWNDNTENETGFTIESLNHSSGPQWNTFAQVGANVTTHTLSVTGPGYDFRIKANVSGAIVYSNLVQVSGPGCYCVPPPGKGAGGPCQQICYSTSTCTPPTSLIISEFRLRGPRGSKDEFVEFYNNSDSEISVCTADKSTGWTLASRTPDGSGVFPVFTIPYDTTIPARGHYLVVNSSPSDGYSLSSYPSGKGKTASGDLSFTPDIAGDSGIALFKTANPANFTLANRLDSVGFSGASGAIPDLYREGSGLTPIGAASGEHTFARHLFSGLPADTNNNSTDFLFLSTNGGVYAGVQSKLGAPGPENLSSPIQRNTQVPFPLLDATVSSSTPPNRVRDLTADPANQSTLGTLSIRRRVLNNTGAPITRLRVRVVNMTTYPQPGVADMRVRSSVAFTVNVNDAATCAATGTPATAPCTVTVAGTLLEQPPNQAFAGGFNSTLSLTLPQALAPGASTNLQFLLGVEQGGSFFFLINVEALP